MAGTKSMVREQGAEQFAACGAHEIMLGHPRDLIDYDHNVNPAELSTAVQAGKVLVAAEYRDTVTAATNTAVFADKLIEERRSAHGVTFGRILGCDQSVKGGSALSVALKPFAHAESAVHEMRGYKVLTSLDVPTFEPVGIFPAANGDHVISVTAKNNDFMSLDRHKWVVGRAVNTEAEMTQAEHNNLQIKGTAETLAYMHANGFYHPDGQVKNWITNASDKIGVIDTEKHVERPLGDDDSHQLAWEDIEHLVKSLVIYNIDSEDDKLFGVGMLANLPLNTVRSSLEELIIHPYLARLEQISGEAKGLQVLQVEQLFDGVASRFYDDEKWPQHFIDANYR